MHSFDIFQAPLQGRGLIEASAGTGKTFAVSMLYLRLVLEKALEVQTILVVTYTEAATKELRDRVLTNLRLARDFVETPEACKDETLRGILETPSVRKDKVRAGRSLTRALADFDEAAIYTIHGFCKRILNDHSFESSVLFDTELITDQGPILQEIADDFWRSAFSGGDIMAGLLAGANGLSPDSLAALSLQLLNLPGARVLPVSARADLKEINRLLDAMRDTWSRESGRIRDILSNDPCLRRGPYRKTDLDEHLRIIDAAFRDTPDTAFLKGIALCATGEIAKNLKGERVPPVHPFFDLCEELTVRSREFGIASKRKFSDYFKREVRTRKRNQNLQSFDDLLLTLRDRLRSRSGTLLAGAIRKKFRAAMIDEFQDTDPVQYEIFETLFGRDHCLLLIGDPKQSIYAFRGADIFSYFRAASRTPEENTHGMKTNWRSESCLVRAVNRLFHYRANPFVLTDFHGYTRIEAAPRSLGNETPLAIRGEPGPGMIFWFLGEETKSYVSKAMALKKTEDLVLREITRILTLSRGNRATLGGRPVRPSDFAVLVLRNKDAERFQLRLAELNIPAVLSKSGNIFETREAGQMERFLAAVSEPGDTARVNAVLAGDMIGCDADTIRSLMEEEKCLDQYEAHLERFHEYRALWKARGFIRMFRKFLSDYRVRERILGLPFGERSLTNLLHLSELLHGASLENGLAMTGLLHWLAQRRISPETGDTELRLERDDDAVRILTVFKSKGLQFPIVFCPFMWQKGWGIKKDEAFRFHQGEDLFLELGPGDDGEREAAEREKLSGLMRLLYVGVTRARNRCYVAYGKIGKEPSSALDYLFSGEVPPKEVREGIKNLSGDALCSRVRALAGDSGGSIRLDTPDTASSPEPLSSPEEDPGTWAARQFTGRIERDWAVVSYSALVSTSGHVFPEAQGRTLKRDEPAGEGSREPAEPVAADDFFAFPRGAVPGTCVHSIFEEVDFTLSDRTGTQRLIQKKLREYGIGSYPSAVLAMLSRVLSAPLLPGDRAFTLGGIRPDRRCAEMEFYYPLQRTSPEVLEAVVHRHGKAGPLRKGAIQTGRLAFHPVHGFMHGFMDLVFEHGGKYYLLDWKTDHLGNRYEDYDPGRLRRVMADNFYDLQSGIYALALHKYLAARVPGYAHGRDFGGVFYLFVRGVNPEIPGNGIFHDRPSRELLEELDPLPS